MWSPNVKSSPSYNLGYGFPFYLVGILYLPLWEVWQGRAVWSWKVPRTRTVHAQFWCPPNIVCKCHPVSIRSFWGDSVIRRTIRVHICDLYLVLSLLQKSVAGSISLFNCQSYSKRSNSSEYCFRSSNVSTVSFQLAVSRIPISKDVINIYFPLSFTAIFFRFRNATVTTSEHQVFDIDKNKKFTKRNSV